MKVLILIEIIFIIFILINNKVSYFEKDVKLIPSVIHKVFITNTTKNEEESIKSNNSLNSWKELNPGYTLKIWFIKDCINYLQKNFSQEHVDCFNKLKPYAYKCDFFRYCLLYNEGGWYTDWGQELLISLNEINNNNYEWVSCLDNAWNYCEENKCMQNAFIGSEPKNIILKKTIEKCIDNINNNYYGTTSLDVTGPYLFGKIFEENKHLLNNYKLGIFKSSFMYPSGYFEIDNTNEIQFVGGQPDNNFSIVATTFMVSKSSLNIEERAK